MCYSKECFSRIDSCSCFGKIPNKTQKTWQNAVMYSVLLCDASYDDLTHGEHKMYPVSVKYVSIIGGAQLSAFKYY